MAVTVQREGRRYYITGDTYALRSRLKSSGCHWDRDRRCWWTGKRAVAESFSSDSVSGDSGRAEPTVSDRQPLLGKVVYQSKAGREAKWFVAARSSNGRLLLTNLSATRVFWAPSERCRWVKEYDREANYGEGITLASLRRFVADQKSSQQSGYSDVREYRAVRADRCRGCRGPIEDAPHHRAMHGYCGACAFDEFDC